ncbi:hypothetical protein [uncultured Litoreibacter sp.]|uniref:hypothetical protein n=1 Tax=uncultured Litoreibacter sp. TaxID=1392394 RepID=UPI002633D593|nr:hypothetical protein [uncultured Litoreibacter sp.]
MGDHEEAWKTQQIYTYKKSLGIVSLTKADLVSIGDVISKEFDQQDVAITIGLPNQRLMYLSTFRNSEDTLPSSDFAKLLIQKREGDGFVRQLWVEFGPSTNFIEAQSIDESWATGIVERLRRQLTPFELPRFLSFDGLGSTVNAIIFFAMIAYLPSLASFGQRVLYITLIVALMAAIAKLLKVSIPNTFVALNLKNVSRIKQLYQRFATIVFGLIGTAAAGFVTIKFELLLGWIEAVLRSTS